MSIAACLLAYSVAVIALGPGLLARLTDRGDAPRLGVTVWLTAIASVVLTWVTAAVLVLVDAAGAWDRRMISFASCLAWLGGVPAGHTGVSSQTLLWALAAGVGVAATRTSARLARISLRLRARAHEHGQAVRLVGHRTSEQDVVVVPAAQPAAYCVSGRPPTIVVTTGALDALDDRQLRAVLAHERAHLAGHHPHIVAALRSLATVFPRVALITDGAAQVTRLLEMCADDTAARRHGRRALLSGLVMLAGAAPAQALAAADRAVLTRAERLAEPPGDHARARARAALTSALTIITAGSLVTAALAVTGALMCGTAGL